jgi:hypothetical protein
MGPEGDLYGPAVFTTLLAPTKISADTNSASFDTKDYTGKGVVAISNWADSGESSGHTHVTILDSATDDYSAFAAPKDGVCGALDAIGAEATLDEAFIDFDACKRYVMVLFDKQSGTVDNVVSAAIAGVKQYV